MVRFANHSRPRPLTRAGTFTVKAAPLAALVPMLLLGLFLGTVPVAGAQAASPTLRPLAEEPGYVDVDMTSLVGSAEPTVEINLGGGLLALLSESMRGNDEDFAQLITGLRSVRVAIYDLDEASAPTVGGQIRTLSNRLVAGGWESVVRVRDEGEQVHILVRTSGNAIAGLTALFSESGESVGFINIVGEFDPARLGRLARQLDLGPLSALDQDGGGKDTAGKDAAEDRDEDDPTPLEAPEPAP